VSDTPRLEPLPEADWDDRTRELLGAVGQLNIFTTLSHHPDLLRRWLRFGGHVLAHSTLPARERELVILRTGWRCDSEYEFGQHTLIGRQVGITDDEIRKLTDESVAGWPDDEALLLRATDELVEDRTLSDATWDELTGRFTTEQVLDLLFTVGQYVMVSTVLRSLGVQRDEGVPGWPA
jgi:4-carboxymuconolactone decarboxylase